MGLDITAYSKLEYLELMDVGAWEEKYWSHERDMPFTTVIAYHWAEEYADRAIPIVQGGVYKIGGEEFGFRAGSYSGYNHWRAQLSLMATGLSPSTIWAASERYADVPFYALINFSDCEGIIGAIVSTQLAADFARYQPQADRRADAWFREKYAAWRKAFEIAADDGLVEFH